jgi:methyl coenzyme M reductase beta subunit
MSTAKTPGFDFFHQLLLGGGIVCIFIGDVLVGRHGRSGDESSEENALKF